VVKLDTSHLDVRKLKKKRRKKRNGGVTIVIEHLQLSMDVEFMNVHVRVKSSTNPQRSLEHVIVVDVQVIIRQSVMHLLMQKGIRFDMRYQIHPTMSLMKMKLYVLIMTLTTKMMMKMKTKMMKMKMKMKTKMIK
jgi:hypothetical protein